MSGDAPPSGTACMRMKIRVIGVGAGAGAGAGEVKFEEAPVQGSMVRGGRCRAVRGAGGRQVS